MDAITERAEFVARDCIACRSNDLRIVAGGGFDQTPLKEFLAADPFGERPEPYLQDARWVFVECQQCGQRFHRNVLSERWNERRFTRWMSKDAIADFIAQNRSENAVFERARANIAHVLRIEFMTRTIRQGMPRILDFGSGDGEFLEACRLMGFDAVGIDRAKRSINVRQNLDEVDGPFDAITLFEVLEHLDDPLTVLLRLRTLIRDNGVLILETPDCTGIDGISSKIDYRKIHPFDHINAFTPKTLRRIAERAGFKVVIPPPAFVVLANRIVRTFLRSKFHRSETRLYFRAA